MQLAPGLLLTAHAARIEFDAESHTYSMDGVQLTNVSRVVGRLKPEFDSQAVAARVARRDGMSVEEVLAAWEDKKVVSQQRGTLVHDYIERSLRGEPEHTDPFLRSNRRLPEMDAFDEWWSDQAGRLDIIGTELMIADAALGIAGTLDTLVHSRATGELHILDWKTNSRFSTTNRWQNLLPPFDDLPDCELATYSLQTSLYRLILERSVLRGRELGDSYIVHLSRDGRAWTHVAMDLRARLLDWLGESPVIMQQNMQEERCRP
jgi:ATP-dependent exoDNAse (exonuclease V) beta subunit